MLTTSHNTFFLLYILFIFGTTSTNANECTNGAHNCDANAICTDTIDSFTCACNAGFLGNGAETGTQVFDVPYSGHTYSSVFTDDPPGTDFATGQLASTQCWTAGVFDLEQWMQLDLGENTAVAGVATKGRYDADQWVTSFKVTHSLDAETWTDVDNGAIFTGNQDRDSLVLNLFTKPIQTRYVRIHPINRYTAHISMRAGVILQLGCIVDDQCVANTHNCDTQATCTPSLASFTCTCNTGYNDVPAVLDVAYSGHSYSSVFTGDPPGVDFGRGRLDSPQCWSAAVSDENQWMRLDLGTLRTISGVVTKGRASPSDQRVTSYRVDVSMNGNTWATVDNATEFPGNTDQETAVYNLFKTPMVARYVRIVPVSWNSFLSMRAAVLYHSDCVDVDECALGTHNCDANAICHDTPGSFVCECNAGFQNLECLARCPGYAYDPATVTGSISYDLVTDCPRCEGTRAYYFPDNVGSADGVSLGTQPTGGEATMMLWIYASAEGPAGIYRRLIEIGIGVSDAELMLLWGSENPEIPQHFLRGPTGQGTKMNYNLPFKLPRSEWHHLAVTFEGTSGKMYYDGVLAASGTSTATMVAGARQLVIGNSVGQAASFRGRLADPRVFLRALSAQEVADIYNGTATAPADLQEWNGHGCSSQCARTTDTSCTPLECTFQTHNCDESAVCTGTEGSFTCSCPTNHFAVTRLGTTQCMLCPPGHYCDGGAILHRCPENYYSATRGATSNATCLPCPGTLLSAPGARAVTDCQPPQQKVAVISPDTRERLWRSTTQATTDGVGTSAKFFGPTEATITDMPNTLLMASSAGGPIRYLNIDTLYMGSVNVAAGSLYTPARYSFMTTLHNNRSKVVVIDTINNRLYAGTLDTSTWEVSFHLMAGGGAQDNIYGCGNTIDVSSLREMRADEIVPHRAWGMLGASIAVIDIGATEICISPVYEGTYNSNFAAVTIEAQNGYIYASFSETNGDAHVFKVDTLADPPDWSDYGNSLSTEALVDDSYFRHLSATCLFNGLHCLFIDVNIATFNMHTGADLGVVNCGSQCATRGLAAVWFDSSPWRLAIFDAEDNARNVVVKDYAYADCLPNEYLWGTGRDVTCLPCPAGSHSLAGAVGEEGCICDVGTVKDPDGDPADEFPSPCIPAPPDDECALGTHDCDASAICTPTNDSFTCSCATNHFAVTRLGTLHCILCPPGHYCDGGSVPHRCPADFYSTTQGANSNSTCLPCPAGKISRAGAYHFAHCQTQGQKLSFQNPDTFERLFTSTSITEVDGPPGTARFDFPTALTLSNKDDELLLTTASTIVPRPLQTVAPYQLGSLSLPQGISPVAAADIGRTIRSVPGNRSLLLLSTKGRLYLGRRLQGTDDVEYFLQLGSGEGMTGSLATDDGCGLDSRWDVVSNIYGYCDIEPDDVIPGVAWGFCGPTTTQLSVRRVEYSASEICVSTLQVVTVGSAALPLSLKMFNGYLFFATYSSSSPPVFVVDTHEPSPDFSQLGDPAAQVPGFSDTSSDHAGSFECTHNALYCAYGNTKFYFYDFSSSVRSDAILCGSSKCVTRGHDRHWNPSSPWDLLILDHVNTVNYILQKRVMYADCLADEYLWGTGRDVTCLPCPAGSHSAAGATAEADCICDAGTVKESDADPTDEFPSPCVPAGDECTAGAHNCDAQATCTTSLASFTCACNPGWAAAPGTTPGTACLDFDACSHGIVVTAQHAGTTYNLPGLTDGIIDNTLFATNGAYFSEVSSCSTVATIRMDLAAIREVTAIIYYPYYKDSRSYCSQSIAVSATGAFTGEQTVLFACSKYSDCGPETSAGRTAPLTAPIATRYVRLQMSRNSINAGIHFLEAIVNYTHGNTLCDANAQCVDTVGPSTCACNAGYEGDGVACDVNECSPGVHNCDAQATCTGTDGSFTCACNAGYEGDGTACTDVDECKQPPRNMARACWDAAAQSFSAQCNAAQSTGTGAPASNALDTTGKNGVYSNTACTHTETGSNQWWYVDLGTAMPVHRLLIWNRDSLQSRLNNFQVWVTDSASPAFTDTSLRCHVHTTSTVTGVNTPLDITCGLVGQYVWIYLAGSNKVLTLCEVEIYEVAESAWVHDCDTANAVCSNTNGSFTCACNTGYSGDGVSCVQSNVDECTEGTHDCGADTTCVDTTGSFFCTCPSGASEESARRRPWAHYRPQFFLPGEKLPDVSGNGRDVPSISISGVQLRVDTANANGAVAALPNLYGTTANWIDFPAGSIPAQFTICSMTRYTGGANARIMQGKNLNWAHGYWNAQCGHAHYDPAFSIPQENFLTTPCTNWMVMCGKNKASGDGFIRDGVVTANVNGGSTAGDSITINNGLHSNAKNEKSNWALGELAIWDRHLTLEEMTQASDYMLAVRDAGPSSAPLCPDVDECAAGTHNCDVNAACNNTKGSFTCACNAGYDGNGLSCAQSNAVCNPTTEVYSPPLAEDISTHTFTYTGSQQTIVAPARTTNLKFHLWGAGGGGGDNGETLYCVTGPGGPGAYLTGSLQGVAPGHTIQIYVGQGGKALYGDSPASTNAWENGAASCFSHINVKTGGGGASTHIKHTDTLVAAAGGGGGGGCTDHSNDIQDSRGGYGAQSPGATTQTLTGIARTVMLGGNGFDDWPSPTDCNRGAGGAGGRWGGRSGYYGGMWEFHGGEGGTSWTHPTLVTDTTEEFIPYTSYPPIGSFGSEWWKKYHDSLLDIPGPNQAKITEHALPATTAAGGKQHTPLNNNVVEIYAAYPFGTTNNAWRAHQGGDGAAVLTFQSSVPEGCYCAPGYYRNADTCQLCTPGYYCEGTVPDEPRIQCPDPGTTSNAGATAPEDCFCGIGYQDNAGQAACTQCTDPTTYCPGKPFILT